MIVRYYVQYWYCIITTVPLYPYCSVYCYSRQAKRIIAKFKLHLIMTMKASSLPQVPVIDLSCPDEEIIPLIAKACSEYGFFQITNHGMLSTMIPSFQNAMKTYFELPNKTRRNQQNARGFFDDELTKQKRDWKQALDVGVPGSRDWSLPDNHKDNACLDGCNVFPQDSPEIRSTIVEYFEECATLSDRLALLMARGLQITHPKAFLQELKDHHASYLRLNYYPPCTEEEKKDGDGILGISPHKDAGFLTILLQDDDCHSLQVLFDDTDWITIHPEPGALTINTGDMCMLWSNGRYQAPLHRVLTNNSKKRYSAPFFYNPGYHQEITSAMQDETPKYHACLYGYFRAVRFAGDLTDLGVEIQLDDYKVGSKSHHLKKQEIFAKEADFAQPFSVERYRPLLLSAD